MRARTFKPSGLVCTCAFALLFSGLPLSVGGDGPVVMTQAHAHGSGGGGAGGAGGPVAQAAVAEAAAAGAPVVVAALACHQRRCHQRPSKHQCRYLSTL
jgi:hypothetical protein